MISSTIDLGRTARMSAPHLLLARPLNARAAVGRHAAPFRAIRRVHPALKDIALGDGRVRVHTRLLGRPGGVRIVAHVVDRPALRGGAATSDGRMAPPGAGHSEAVAHGPNTRAPHVDDRLLEVLHLRRAPRATQQHLVPPPRREVLYRLHREAGRLDLLARGEQILVAPEALEIGLEGGASSRLVKNTVNICSSRLSDRRWMQRAAAAAHRCR